MPISDLDYRNGARTLVISFLASQVLFFKFVQSAYEMREKVRVYFRMLTEDFYHSMGA